MKRRALKSNDNSSFWSSAKRHKVFTKIDNSVKSSLQKWIIYHTHLIQSPIKNYYVTVKFDDGIRIVKIELHHKVLLQVSVHELHINMIKKMLLNFPWHMMKRTFPY